MAEDYAPYFLSIIANRAMTISEDEYLLDNHTLSLETQNDILGESIYDFVWSNFPSFISKIRYLSQEDQELLLSYYIVGKTQTSLAVVNRSTQTICSSKIRMAAKRLGAHIILEDITLESIQDLLVKFGRTLFDKNPEIKLSQIIYLYYKLGSPQEVSSLLHIHRPDLRRVMNALAKDLLDHKDLKLSALGAFVQGLIDHSSSKGYGPSKSRMLARGHLYLKDPEILGKFEVDICDPNFKYIYYPRANQ